MTFVLEIFVIRMPPVWAGVVGWPKFLHLQMFTNLFDFLLCLQNKFTLFLFLVAAFSSKNISIRLRGYKGHWIKRENHSQAMQEIFQSCHQDKLMKLSQSLIKTETSEKRLKVAISRAKDEQS